MLSRVLAAILCLLMPPAARADTDLQAFLEQTLASARAKDHLPAVAAMIQIDGRVAAEAVMGVRALGHDEAATTKDRWHIGSDTKAFTAVLIARLVEQGTMSFDDSLAASFPALAPQMHPAYRGVTIAQLLSHTAGLPALTDDRDFPEFLATIRSARGVRSQRAAIVRKYLSQAPPHRVGTFEYSNIGYIIAGAIAESHTGLSWEELIRQQVFAPLGIVDAGFGAPGRTGRLDQPRGHRDAAGQLVAVEPAAEERDNPPALGPAGTISISLRDWMRFAQDQLDGVHGRGKLLRTDTYRRLHTPVSGNYALGWGVKLDDEGAPLLLTHSGSNGYWLADIRIMPRHDIVVLVATNAGNEAANLAIQDIGQPIKDRLKPYD